MAKADGSIVIDTRLDTTNMQKSTDQIQGMFKGLVSGAKKVGAAIAAAFAVKQIIAFSRECIELGSNLDEVQNVVDVTFGKMSGEIDRWSKDAITQFGLSELSAKQYTSTIGAMFKSMGITGDALVEMSEKMAGLAGDMASFYNLDTDTAFQKIRSGISGETEPLKQLGINLSEANLEQFRLNQGMETSYKQMNQQQKALLRYNYLLSVTSDAQGDFSRTSSSWANQVRVLRLQLQSIKADIGKGLINVLTPVLKVINTILQGIARMASAFKAFTALITGKKADTSASAGSPLADMASDFSDAADSADEYANATDKTAKATQKANKANNKYTSGLDKIHQYQTQTADAQSGSGKSSNPASSATPASSALDFGSLSEGETTVDKLATKMKALYDWIMDKMKPAIEELKRLGGNVGGAFSWVLDNVLRPFGNWVGNEVVPRFITTLTNVLRIANAVIEAAKPGWQWFWDNILLPIAKWTGGVFLAVWDAINEGLAKFAKWCQDNPQIIENITVGIIAFFAAWKVVELVKSIGTLVGSISGLIGWFGKLVAGINPVTLAIAGVIAIGVLLWKNWDTVKEVAGKAWSAIKDTVVRTAATIKTNIQKFIEAVRRVWDKGWELIRTGASAVWSAITSTLTTAWNGIKTTASNVFNSIKIAAQTAWNGITQTASSVWDGVKTKITTVFNTIKTAAEKMRDAIRDAFVTAFTSILNLIKKPINGIIGAINGIIRGVVTGINAMINALNRVRFSVPKWVPGIGGNSFGLNIPTITNYPQIPKLAQGAVIPPNAPFAAVLGDQRNGNNIEAPESLIRKIVREENGRASGKYEFKAIINRRVLFDEIISEAKMRQSMTAANPFELA